MSVFGAYARYYDLLYRDKDYRSEASFVDQMLREHAPKARRLLELGCGTGRHAESFADLGYSLHGVDVSREMLDEALHRKACLPEKCASLLSFSSGDVRSVRLGKLFDAVRSLFHVMSYQTTNQDLSDAFATARAHLGEGGVFIFDCWYGPAVFTSPPEVRARRLGDEQVEILRLAEPEWDVNCNTVTVNYDIHVIDKSNREHTHFSESHRMRYLFLPEIEELLAGHDMSLVSACEWMSGCAPGAQSWNLCVAAVVKSG